jgi:cystine transport system permease protein
LPESLALALQSAPLLLRGAGYTLVLSLGGMAFGLAIGLGIALLSLSPSRLFRFPARIYVSFFRGTPLLVQLFVIYYGLPQFGLRLDPITSALIGFSLNVGAYTGEILRAAISSIEHGQWEAASSIGMSKFQAMRRIILPQSIRVALPPLGNSFISLVKDTSLAATIQVPELFRQAQLITARTYDVFTMYLSAALLYWILSAALSALQHRLEVRAARHVRERRE